MPEERPEFLWIVQERPVDRRFRSTRRDRIDIDPQGGQFDGARLRVSILTPPCSRNRPQSWETGGSS